MRQSKFPAHWTGPIAIAIAHAVVAFVSLELTWWSSGLASIWPANAILLAALLIAPRRDGWRYALAVGFGSIAANSAIGFDLAMPAIFALSNVLECYVAAALIWRAQPRAPDLERTDQLLRFVIASVVAAALSATVSAIFMLLVRGAPFAQSWLSWFASDALGLLIVTPLLLIARDALRRRTLGRGTAQIKEAAMLFALVVALALTVFVQSDYPLLFAVTPLVILATFRLRSLGAAIATLIVAVIGSWCTATGTGPIALVDGGMPEKIYLLQIYLAATFLAALPVAAVLAERDALADAAHANAADSRAVAVEAERIAATDELTGVASRRKLLARLEDEVRASGAAERPLAVAIFDIDHFKRINDTLGHDGGDRVLKTLAELTVNTVRINDLVGRLGGEEFAIVMPGATIDQASAVAERLRAASAKTHLLDGDCPPVTISIGVAALSPGLTGAALLKAADTALYVAKAQGRNRLALAA